MSIPRSARGTVARRARRLADLVYPPFCLGCRDNAPGPDGRLCDACTDSIARERQTPTCPRCAASIAPFELASEQCRSCRRRKAMVPGTLRVGQYDGVLGRLIRSYKYDGRESIEPMLIGWLAEAVERAPWLGEVEGVVPVPTHWRHRLVRPLYVPEALATGVARRTNLPEARVLRRVRGGPHQIGLSYMARLDNVRGAFAVRRGVTLRKARLLLIDDVKTTGATVEECAKVLRRAGAQTVYAAVVATAGWTFAQGYAIRSA